MATPTNWPETLQAAVVFFSNPDTCLKAAIELRWHGGPVTCPTCGSQDVHFIATRKMWRCKGAKHTRQQFSVRIGTVMEDSPLSLDKWLLAMWLLASAKNGISSYELHRAIGISQKSAWFLLHRIRLAMQAKGGGKLDGGVEIDETFIGAKARNMHKGKKEALRQGKLGGLKGKTAVLGMLQRHPGKGQSRVRLHIVPKVKRGNLVPHITDNVEQGTNVFTDALPSYDKLYQHGYIHEMIDHAQKYADGHVHTNGIENFWALLKRTIGGTYVSVEPFHLFRYLDEQAFRFNSRHLTDSERFVMAGQAIADKRLTFAELTAKEATV
jgi:transposase-like protein